MKAYQVIKDFEAAVAEYTGAPYVVAVDSCTNALFLCLMWAIESWDYKQGFNPLPGEITIPKHTYLSVPQQIIHAEFEVIFTDLQWSGYYQLKPFPIYDSARRFTSNMFRYLHVELDNQVPLFMCTSHHWTKPLGIERGGCILHNDLEADIWFRRARFHGRTEGVHPKDDNPIMGWNMMMLPSVAANGLVRLSHLPKDNPDLPNDNYPDLSKMDIFK